MSTSSPGASIPDPRVCADTVLPCDRETAVLVGRLWCPQRGPRLVTVAGRRLLDVTELGPTMSDLLERPGLLTDLQGHAKASSWSLGEIVAATAAEADRRRGAERSVDCTEPVLLSPVDLQVLKAAGVTFAHSLLERVIEERVGGDKTRAATVRDQLDQTLGGSIRRLVPGSPEALAALEVMREHGLWSQYLQVGLGVHPEVFTKAPILSSVGHGWDIGVSVISSWNNPEPELVLVIDSAGRPVGATLGNDANLRDIEGSSALLLPLAKDNNGSAALGPFIRLFDDRFSLEDVAAITITLRIDGRDGFLLESEAPQSDISRTLDQLIAHTINRRHQYPDGLVLYCGTPFAPIVDRDAPGMGFTHHDGDIVLISSPRLGTLVNRVTPSEQAPPWTYGVRELFASLSRSCQAPESPSDATAATASTSNR